MSVSEVILTGSGLSGGFTGRDAGDVSATYRATYRVKVSDPLDTPDIVVEHFKTTTSLPWIGRRFKLGNGFDSDVICTSVDPSHIENSGGWYDVSCRFEPENLSGGGEAGVTGTTESGEVTEDPLKFSVEIDVSWMTISEPVYSGRFMGFSPAGIVNPFLRPGRNKAITNSAMKVLDPPLEEENYIKVIRITQNFNRYDGARYDRFHGTVNNNLQVIARPGVGFRQVIQPYYGKMAFYGASLGWENGVHFWRETKEVHIHPRSWVRQVLDHGIDELWFPGDTRDGVALSASDFPAHRPYEFATPVDASGYPMTQPGLFNGRGKLLENPGDPPVYLRWLTATEEDWTGIPF